MVTDQFGMAGLLTFIWAAERNPNLVILAPGIDLTTLGLNLNSPEYVCARVCVCACVCVSRVEGYIPDHAGAEPQLSRVRVCVCVCT